jgi:hypothetical protein
MAAWALVPWLNLVVVAAATPEWDRTGIPAVEVLNRAAVSFAILLSLWGTSRVTDRVRRLRADLAEAVEQTEPDVHRLFRGLDSVAVPVVLTVAVGIVLPLDEAFRGEGAAALIQLVTWLLIGIPLSTAVWVYVTLQVGLMRLGRGQLTLREYHGDRSLGLRPVGGLAFTGFWMLFGSVAPLVLTGLSDVPVTVVGISVLAAAVVLFFLSLRDLHRRMVRVKTHELDRALRLYEEAYQEVQREPTLGMLQQRVGLLNAAEALEKRAERIQAWPFDEATFARVVTIVSSSAAGILARLLLAPTGL